MKRISPGYIFTSAAYCLGKKLIKSYEFRDKKPEIGDVVYGKVVRKGQHTDLENKSGRIHSVNEGTKGLFVFGNRYAPDYYEAIIPDDCPHEIDLVARSGVIATMLHKNSVIQEPTKIKVLGYVIDDDGEVLNTRRYPIIKPKATDADEKDSRAKLILVVGTSMNAGKSYTAAACCWALSSMGHNVRASKITGTASLKDILRMQDCGASYINDFTYFGYPSTYMMDESELLRIFNETDLKYANNPRNFWVVELADGIIQRETAMLLSNPTVQKRIHRLIFAASDAFGAVGGLQVLQSQFGLKPDAVSGKISSSPLGIKELSSYTDTPVFDNMSWDMKHLSEILL